VHADEIAEAFWPGSDTSALNNVRHFVHSLRENLEPNREKRTPSSFVIAARGGYMLSRERVWIDADEFEARVEAGMTAFSSGQSTSSSSPTGRATSSSGHELDEGGTEQGAGHDVGRVVDAQIRTRGRHREGERVDGGHRQRPARQDARRGERGGRVG